jgi:putative redox protein
MRVVARRKANGASRSSGFAHEVDIEDGAHTLVADEPAAAGGADTGPSPTRLVAAGLASCIAITMEMYAERKGWDLGAVEVEVEVEVEGHVPSAFSAKIHLPTHLDDEQRSRLLAVAGKCPVHKLIAAETDVAVTYRGGEG